MKTAIIERLIEIESKRIKRTKLKTDIIKMKNNQVSTIPDTLSMKTRIGLVQIKTEMLNIKTETIQMKF